MGIVPTNTDKRTLRAQLLAQRSSMSIAEKQALDAQLLEKIEQYLMNAPLKQGDTIALYAPIRGEPDLMPLAQNLWRKHFKVALPVVVAADSPLKFVLYTPETSLKRSTMGILEPSLDDAMEGQPDAVVLPCVGFNARNYRLGYGGGFYDRTLGAWQTRPLTMGVAYGFSCCAFEPSSFDVPLDVIVSV